LNILFDFDKLFFNLKLKKRYIDEKLKKIYLFFKRID